MLIKLRQNIFPMVGMIANLAVFATPAYANEAEIVTGLPYSTQWIYERTSCFVYLSYNSAQLRDSTLNTDQYSANFGNKGFDYPAFDLFNHIVSFADPESSSRFRDVSLWGRYSLGFADRKGSLSNSRVSLDPNLEKSSLLILTAKIGALLSFDRWDFVKPYAGIELSPYFFRQSADITGAEQQGASYSYGPVVGAHLPLLLNGKVSFMTEYRHSTAGNGSKIIGSSQALSAGMGLAL